MYVSPADKLIADIHNVTFPKNIKTMPFTMIYNPAVNLVLKNECHICVRGRYPMRVFAKSDDPNNCCTLNTHAIYRDFRDNPIALIENAVSFMNCSYSIYYSGNFYDKKTLFTITHFGHIYYLLDDNVLYEIVNNELKPATYKGKLQMWQN